MTRPIQLIVVEGKLEEPVSLKLLKSLGLDPPPNPPVNKRGNEAFWADAHRYNDAAKRGPVLALVDLEATTDCPPTVLRTNLAVERHPDYILRIMVRMVESWLLGDRDNLSRFLQISAALFPDNPDAESSPKLTLVNLARRSRSRAIREDLVPAKGAAGIVGNNYTSQLAQFVQDHWQPLEAQRRSESLRRAIKAIQKTCEL